MKLKKIASLALAGVMAVSMLAGCAGKTNTDNGEGQGEVETTVTISDVLNQAQTGDAKVTFSDSAALNTALQAALVTNGIDVAPATLLSKVSGLLSVADSKIEYGAFQFQDAALNGLVNGDMAYYYCLNETGTGISDASKAAGTYTTVNYIEFTGYSSQEAALKAIAKYMDESVLSKLAAHSTMTWATKTNYDGKFGTVEDAYKLQHKTENKDTYYTYSYTGNAALVVTNETNGTTTYGLFYIINQTLTEATV